MATWPAGVSETHVSVVVFVGDRAYKVKKPVTTAFLDYATREQREAVCHREVELNRRLAPDVYLGVADVTGPDGQPCDHIVVMRRMPEERRLSTLVRDTTAGHDEAVGVARVMAAFHARADRGPAIDATATPEFVRGLWVASIEQMGPFVGGILDGDTMADVERRSLAYIDGRHPLFHRRLAEGRAVDGHGDLLADDIFCLPDGPRILDCLEFDDTLRYGDVLLDIAFLAMDLERIGRPDLAGAFLAAYREFAAETHPPSLEHHYVAYRALVRAKVACLRAAQGDPTAAATARGLLAQCHAHLHASTVRLVVVGGLPGTGKTTLAEGLARRVDASVLRSDEIRKELAGLRATDRAVADYGVGLYAPEQTAATYRELLRRAEVALGLGESVVLDASWTDAGHRIAAAELAARAHVPLVALRCTAPPEVAAARLTARLARGRDASDATPAVATAMAAAEAPWSDAATIDTSGSFATALEQAAALASA